MRYWWVNQNQTYREESEGGYLWSPKRNRNGARNQFYENMREVSPGDRVFSFRDTRIVSVGTATSNCYDAPKPTEFGKKGENWDVSGWMVDVTYDKVQSPIRPKDHIEQLRPVLPKKYSPLQQNGDGLQSVYLAELSTEFVSVLEGILQTAGNTLPTGAPDIDSNWNTSVTDFEEHLKSDIQASDEIEQTEKEQLVRARRGQGRFRENVQRIESRCRVTGVSDSRFLIASHIKPWRSSTNSERLDGENGLLLTPTVDHLFDNGFISFSDDGELLISPVVDRECLRKLGVPVDSTFDQGNLSVRQRQYLSYHRRNIFLESGHD